MDDVIAGTRPEHDGIAGNVGPELLHRHNRAERDIADGILIVADEFLPEQRAKAVGGDERWGSQATAICGCHADRLAMVHKAGHHRIRDKLDRSVLPASIEQYVMQVDAMND